MDDFVRPRQHRRRDGEAEGFGGLEVDDELELGRLLESVGDIKPLLSRFPQGGDGRTKAARTPLDLDGARRARAVSRMVPPPGSISRTRVSSGAGAGRRGGPWSAAPEQGPGPACGDQSEGRPPHFAARCYVSQRCSTSRAGKGWPTSCCHSFYSIATCDIHGRRECHWHANWYHPSSEDFRGQFLAVGRAQTNTFDAVESPHPRCRNRGNDSRSRTA